MIFKKSEDFTNKIKKNYLGSKIPFELSMALGK